MATQKCILYKVVQKRLYNGVWACAISPTKYVNEAVNTVRQTKLQITVAYTDCSTENTYAMRCDPEMDVSPKIVPDAEHHTSNPFLV